MVGSGLLRPSARRSGPAYVYAILLTQGSQKEDLV